MYVCQRGGERERNYHCWHIILWVLTYRIFVSQVARSRISDSRVWRRARDYLGLMNEPAISLSVLGPSQPSCENIQNPGTVNWSEGSTKMIAHIPFYILGDQEGKPILFGLSSI